MNLVLLGLILVAMIGTAIYVSSDDKKKKNEQEEEYNSLNDYILLKDA